MNRTRILISLIGFFSTFIWLLLPETKGTVAVLWPSVLAVGLAFVTRDIYLSLFLGAFSGTLLLQGGNPWAAFYDLFIGRDSFANGSMEYLCFDFYTNDGRVC
ncbi:MAG: hypothetical protein EXS25_07820 [Pedosphaera sp.]|nr:hypothetical protein [Pedosphaera sp.]